jgi:hypothetical protein
VIGIAFKNEPASGIRPPPARMDSFSFYRVTTELVAQRRQQFHGKRVGLP